MSIANVIPELWSAELLVAFRKQTVFTRLVNRNYEGEIRRFGDTVKITTPGSITVGPYSGTVTYQTATTAQQSLVIDQDDYWAFDIDDLDRAQANVDTMRMWMAEAADSLAQRVDQNLANLYTGAGLTQIELDVGSDDFYDKMVLAGQQLDEENVPRAGRWVVMSPKGYADLLKNDAFIHATQAGDTLIRSGALGTVSGFEVLMSNNLASAEASHKEYLYGTNAAITFAEQLLETEPIRREGSFADAMRGRLVYGRKVVRPNALGVIHADES